MPSTVSPQAEMCHHGLKRGGTVDVGLSIECPRPKECRSERGRSRKRKHFRTPECTLPRPFLLPPMAPNHPTTGSVSVPSVDLNRGPPSLDKGACTQGYLCRQG